MGYNTTVVILSDGLNDIEKDPEFGRELVDAIRVQAITGQSESLSSGAGNVGRVISSYHSSNDALILTGHNTGKVISNFVKVPDEAWKDEDLLTLEMADQLAHAAGHDLVPKRGMRYSRANSEVINRLRAELGDMLRLCVQRGEHTLSAGGKSDVYVDCKGVTLSPKGSYLCGSILRHMTEQMEDKIGEEIVAIGGMTLGADPLVSCTVMSSYLHGKSRNGFIIRKESKGHGTGNRIEGLNGIPEGCSVVILEDVTTTGKTVLEATRQAETNGLKVKGVLTVVDREEGARNMLSGLGYSFDSIFRLSDLYR